MVRSVLALVLLTALSSPGFAEEKKLSEAQRKVRRAQLRARAVKWFSIRKKLVGDPCPRCEGKGFIIEIVFRGGVGRRMRTECPNCHGRKKLVYSKHYRKLYYEMMTPAFRLMPKMKDALEKDYRRADDGDWPATLTEYAIKKLELVTNTHGIVWFTANKDTTQRPMQWIWTQEQNGRPTWFVYSKFSDGPWAKRPPEKPQPLTDEERKQLEAALANFKVAFKPVEFLREGRTLVVRLQPRENAQKPEDHVGANAVALARAVLGSSEEWEGLRSEWLFRWRNKLGQLAWSPLWIGELSREKFAKIVWKNLNAKEQSNLLAWRRLEHEGWVLWHGSE